MTLTIVQMTFSNLDSARAFLTLAGGLADSVAILQEVPASAPTEAAPIAKALALATPKPRKPAQELKSGRAVLKALSNGRLAFTDLCAIVEKAGLAPNTAPVAANQLRHLGYVRWVDTPAGRCYELTEMGVEYVASIAAD